MTFHTVRKHCFIKQKTYDDNVELIFPTNSIDQTHHKMPYQQNFHVVQILCRMWMYKHPYIVWYSSTYNRVEIPSHLLVAILQGNTSL